MKVKEAPLHAKEAKTHTRDRILQAARQLFSEGGYDSVSVRDVTSHANVSLSSINYHFGGKDELVEAVVNYSWTQIASEIYDELVRQDRAGKAPSLRLFAKALVEPLATQALANDPAAKQLIHLIIKGYGKRSFEQMPEEALRAWKALSGELIRRFQILRPTLTEEQAGYKIHFTLGVLLHSVIHLPENHSVMKLPKPQAYDTAVQLMLDYCTAGLNS